MVYDKYYSGTLIVSDEGDLLLQQRENKPYISNPGLISVFGGTAYLNETPKDCAFRELLEETNIIAQIDDLIYLWETDIFFNNFFIHCTFFYITNICKNNLVIYEGECIVVANKKNIFNLNKCTNLCIKTIEKYFDLLEKKY